MTDNNSSNGKDGTPKKSLMETVRSERGFRDHFDSIGALAKKVIGRNKEENTEHEKTTPVEKDGTQGTSGKGALIVGIFAFGAIGTAATMYYRVRASSLRQKGYQISKTRTAAEAMRARSGVGLQGQLTEAQQQERQEHMERLQDLVSRWQYLLMRHQKRHPSLYTEEQLLEKPSGKTAELRRSYKQEAQER